MPPTAKNSDVALFLTTLESLTLKPPVFRSPPKFSTPPVTRPARLALLLWTVAISIVDSSFPSYVIPPMASPLLVAQLLVKRLRVTVIGPNFTQITT